MLLQQQLAKDLVPHLLQDSLQSVQGGVVGVAGEVEYLLGCSRCSKLAVKGCLLVAIEGEVHSLHG